MSILLLLITAATALYLGINRWLSAILLIIAAGLGLILDGGHWLSIVASVLMLASLLVLLPSPFRRHLISAPMLG